MITWHNIEETPTNDKAQFCELPEITEQEV